MMNDELNLQDFNKMVDGEIMASGVLPNSPEGIFMTRDGGELRWVAKKGYGHDWTIYCHWSDKSENWVLNHGDKIFTTDYIKRCLPCTDEVFKLYRF